MKYFIFWRQNLSQCQNAHGLA